MTAALSDAIIRIDITVPILTPRLHLVGEGTARPGGKPPIRTGYRKNGRGPRFVIARRPTADVAISGRHSQFVPAAVKTLCTDCVCSGAH